MTCEITDGVENGVQYGVRVFLRGRYGFQTSRQNAQALVTPQAGIAGSELPVGTLLRLGEGGQGVLFYLSAQDYESANNGLGLMLCTRKDCYNAQSWDQGGNHAYASSSVDSWLVSAYKTMLEPVVCDAIAPVKIRYTPGNGNNVVVTLEREVFLPSLTEFGLSHVNANTEGARLPVAASLRAAYTTAGFGRKWTRSPCKPRSDEAMYADSSNNAGDMAVTDAYGLLPSFCLPATMRFHPTPNADGSYSPVGSPYADSV